MRLYILLAFFVMSSAHATDYLNRKITLQFSVTDSTEGIELSCNRAERIALDHLETLGAKNILISCQNDLEPWSRPVEVIPMVLNIGLEVPVPRVGDKQEVLSLESSDEKTDCYFHVAFLKNILPLFPGMKVTKRKIICEDNRSDWEFDLSRGGI